ncbi:MAG: small ribosomal subunit Rsm22 family protein [Haloferacaceae archaeon]
MVDRQAVLDNARYLRGVRPVDPEEIHEYVAGQPHPAAVRRVLREAAYELGLSERDDGTFVPVNEEPVPVRGWAPDALPNRHERALLDLLVERLGPDWHRGETGDRLRSRLRDLKEDYYRQQPVEYDETAALAYAIYHLPDYWAVPGYVLDRVAERGLLSRRLRVLDVGAGVGGPALGLADYLPDDAVVDYHAVEPSPAADVFERLAEATPRTVRTTVHRTDVESFEFPGTYDLVLCANVLSELDDPVAVGERCLDALAPDGSFVALAPADRATSTGLREVERALAPSGGDVSVYDPTHRLWPGAAPTDRCWSFDVGTELSVPAFQAKLDEAGGGGPERLPGDGTFVNTAVRFSYAVLRPDGTRRVDVRASPERHARMAESDRHVTDRVDLLAAKLSHDLTDGADANPLYLVGDGSQAVDHYAVLTRASALNRALADAPYASVLAFENVLVLWNDDEAAYNLVVDGETVVDRVA